MSTFAATPFLYGIKHEGNLRAELLLSDPTSSASALQLFSDRKADIALLPAAAVPGLDDARVITEYCIGGVASAREALLADGDELLTAWKSTEKQPLPFAFAVWVAHTEVEPETVEALQHALTFGLEHCYESLLENAGGEALASAYDRLSHYDYIFDNQKQKALQKFWDSGLKVAPRANPG